MPKLNPISKITQKIILSFVVVGSLHSFVNAERIRLDDKNIVLDTETKFIWQDDNDAKIIKKNWQGAIDYCENLKLGGFDNWKLPKMNILHVIGTGIGLKNIVSGATYWAEGTTIDINKNLWYDAVVWHSDSNSGYMRSKNKEDNKYVRCVLEGNFEILTFFLSFVRIFVSKVSSEFIGPVAE